jgi:uncharacterized membrane protein YgdD (TMEM256/DUF423 family)
MTDLARRLATAAAILGFLAVALGAFGAHALKARLAPDLLAIFETGTRYQMYHALAMLAAAWAVTVVSEPRFAALAGWCFLGGTVVFSGSLYALAWSGVRALGAITPLGGGLLLLGWWWLAMAFWRRRS